MSFARFNGGGGSGGGFSRFNSGSVADDPYNTDKLDNQIQNADTRIQDAGYTPQDGDSRNWFEKLTNLPQHQNFLFDTLELLGRPGNAVKNVLDKAVGSGATESVGEAALKGISGKEKITGADIAEHRGVENGFGRFLLGTTTDILTDPLTYVPGGVIADGAKAAVKPIGALAKTAYSAAEKIPGFARFSENTLKPAVENVKDGLGYAFNPNYKIDETLSGGKSDALKSAAQQTDNSRAFMQEESMKTVAGAARDAGGIETGNQAARLMEEPLKVNIDADKTINELVKGKSISVNQVGGDLPDIVNKMNQKILGSKAIKSRIEQRTQQLENIDKGIKKIEDHPNPTDRMVERLDEYAAAKDRVTADLDKIKQGIHFKPSEDGLSFKLVNPKTSLYKRGLGDSQKFLDDISPKGTFDEIVKPELADSLRPLVTKVLQEGNINVPTILKGTQEQRELKRLFGDKLQIVNNKKSTTLKINQKDADSMYYQLQGAKPVIPESLTNANKPIDQSGLQFNDVQFTNRIKDINVPRPEREAVTDPKIQQAAKTLMESNNTIRQFAEDNGIQIPELEGYMTHVFSQAERDARKINKPINVDSGAFGNGNPNKSILKQRELTGSVEDINDRLGKPKFEPNAYFATGIGQKRLIDYVHAVSLRKQVLQNPDFATPFIKGMDVPKNAEVIDSNNYTFLKDSGDSLDGVVQKESVGGQYIVTKQAKMALDRYQKLNTDEGTKAFLKAFDSVQGLWKKGALFSLGYHFRNQAGAMFNNYVGGMNTLDLAKYTPEGFKEVAKSISGKESPMFTEFRKQGLGSSTLSQVEYAKTGQEPEQAIQKTVENMSKDTKGQITQRLNPLNAFQTSAEVGNFFDQANRFSLYKWARDKGMTAEDAAQKVRDVQFDYSKTTPFEKNIATRVFPFYRWMRNNIPFQIKSFINDPRKYQFLNKARLNAQQSVGLNEDNIPDYMKEQFAIPLYGKNGKGKMLGLNLPLTDLTKLSSPGKALVDSLSATIKTPAELALNYNTFLGKPIQKFQGQQQQYQIPYTDVAFGVPIKAGYALNQATGQIGRGLSGFLQKPDTKDQDTLNRLPSLGISSMTKPFDAEKYAYYEKLDQLKQAQDLMLFIQQQTGEKPRTLSQIKH